MASVEVEREFGGVADHLRSYEIVVDKHVVGYLGPGETYTVDLSCGHHELFVKVDWCRSNKIDVDVVEGQKIKLRCAPRSNVFTDLYWATVGCRRYIKLTQIVS